MHLRVGLYMTTLRFIPDLIPPRWTTNPTRFNWRTTSSRGRQCNMFPHGPKYQNRWTVLSWISFFISLLGNLEKVVSHGCSTLAPRQSIPLMVTQHGLWILTKCCMTFEWKSLFYFLQWSLLILRSKHWSLTQLSYNKDVNQCIPWENVTRIFLRRKEMGEHENNLEWEEETI